MSRMGNSTEAQDTAKAEYEASPVEMARALAEAREVLKDYEASALADVAATLAEVAESLARTSRELRDLSPNEWMDAEEAAVYLKRTPKTFRNIVAAGEIPPHVLIKCATPSSTKDERKICRRRLKPRQDVCDP